MGLPALAAANGSQIDNLIGWIHIFMLVLFVGWGGFFVYCLIRFRRSRQPVANYTGVRSHASNYAEIAIAVIEAILLVGFSIPLWAARVDHLPSESEALVVEVTGEQFAWNIHYAGPDGNSARATSSCSISSRTPSQLIATIRQRKTTSRRSISSICQSTSR
jgi:cytochrome c oxidase subunit 2